MAESKAIDTKTSDDLDNLKCTALDDSTVLKKEKPLETKDDSKEANNGDVEDTVKQALQANSNTREMFEQGSEELASQFRELGVDAHPEDGVLEDLPSSMQSTSFEDLSLPFLKERVGKYSAWLKENKDSLSSEQYEVNREVVEKIEAVSETDAHIEDSDEVQMQRAQRMMDNTLQLESLRKPPTELITSMQSTIQSLLPKNTSLPKMKEFVREFPKYLEGNKYSLSPEQYDTYCKQFEVTRKFVAEVEALFAGVTDSEEERIQKKRAQRIVDYLIQLESLGKLPAELDDVTLENTPSTQSNMQLSLLKDISLPNMREPIEKSSVCLEENKGSVASDQCDTCSQQAELNRKVDEFEAKSEN